MKNAPMRFDGFSLHHNPHKLLIEHSGNISELISPCCQPDSVHLGNRLRKISGEGELYGSDCIRQYQALERLHRLQRRGKLLLPHMAPIYAYLKELKLRAEPTEDTLTYSFVFEETQSPRQGAASGDVYVTGEAGESLWDISDHCGVDIEELVRLNPQIKYIDRLRAEERVRLC